MMQRRKKTPGAYKATTHYLLTGLVKCGECGHSFQGNKRKDAYSNDYISYRRGCRKQKRECNNREIKRDYLEAFILQELEKNILNDEAIPVLSKVLNEKMNDKNEINKELLKSLEQKLDKVNKETNNIMNAIMNGIVNNMLKDKLDELEQVKLNLDLKMNELSIENKVIDGVFVTEEQIRSIFSRFKEFVLERNIPECKKFIEDYIKEVIVYKDHVEVVFNVVFCFAENTITHNLTIKGERK